MTFSRALIIVSLLLFGAIGMAAWQKRTKETGELIGEAVPIELATELAREEVVSPKGEEQWPRSAEGLPEADRIQELFNLGTPQLPIVETIVYSSRVDWLKHRPAWIADYAAHYHTSRHFIARSLNGIPNYTQQEVANGDHFTVFRPDVDLSFHLVVDVSRCKMWLYYFDATADERVLLKVYDVGLGRLDPTKPSGLLTPLGHFSLGDKVGIYRPGNKGYYQGEKIEMITVFGTRWIPFEKVLTSSTAPAKGYGLHGTPWTLDNHHGQMIDTVAGIGGYEGDGCIRMRAEDVEELFSIVITMPTEIQIVRDFYDAALPGSIAIE